MVGWYWNAADILGIGFYMLKQMRCNSSNHQQHMGFYVLLKTYDLYIHLYVSSPTMKH